MATFTVTRATDPGVNSEGKVIHQNGIDWVDAADTNAARTLSWALELANRNNEEDVILFDIGAMGGSPPGLTGDDDSLALRDKDSHGMRSVMAFATSVMPAPVGGDGGDGGKASGAPGALGGRGAGGDNGGNGLWGGGGSGGGGGSSGGGSGGTGGSDSFVGASGGSGGGGGSANGDPNGGNGGTGGAGDGAVGGGGGGGGGGAHGAPAFPTFNAGGDTLSGGAGGDGGSAAAGFYYAGGGGGGGGGYGLSSAGSFSNYGTIRGGAGGHGGHGSLNDGGGGQGGAGGVGAQASNSFQNEGTVLGGQGGQGGDGDVAGAGGVGGAGLVFNTGIVQNTGTITGGNAGLRGSSTISNTVDPGDAAGGAGLVGTDVTVYNNGTISGGLDADGSRAPAIIFTAGTSKLVMTADSVMTGAVRSEGTDVLALAGTGGQFSLPHLNALDSGALFQGFETLSIEGGVWVLNGAPSLSGIDFSVRGGATLNLAGDLFTGSGANGADPSDINVLFGGTLTGAGQAYNVDVAGSSTLAPGDGVGTLKTALLTLQHASTVRFELGATQSDKLEVGEVVFGTNGIGGAYLQLSTVAGDRPAIGQVITLIEDYTSSATQGTFLLLPDDQVGESGGVRFTISYDENVDGRGDSNDVTLTVLDLAPAPLSASVNGAKLVLTLDEALGGDGPDASLFSVSVAGVSRAVTAVAVAGDKVTLTLASAVSNGQTVTLDYSDFSASNDGDVLEDATGLDSASFSGFAVTNTTPVPSSSGGGVAPPVTEADVGRVFSALALPIPAGEAASVVAAIKAGTLTLDAYIASLIPRVQDTMLPALVVSQFFGSTPSQEHLAALSAFNATQLAAYTKQGVLDPRIGPYEALGLGVSETIAFGSKYAALSDADFVAKAYQDVFGRLPGADQAKHFSGQILYFETLYAGAGQTTAQADLHAKGAILGQMLGVAVITEAASHNYDDAAIAFLQSAAKGQAQYGEGMLI